MLIAIRAFLLPAVLSLTVVQAQNPNECVNNDNGQCDLEPYNPVTCGETYSECGYDNYCLADVSNLSEGTGSRSKS